MSFSIMKHFSPAVCLCTLLALWSGNSATGGQIHVPLYGVTGDGAADIGPNDNGRQLYKIDKTNASKSLIGQFVSSHVNGDTGGSEDDGEVIGADGESNMFHMSGLRSHQRETDHWESFERVFIFSSSMHLQNIPFKGSDLTDANPANWTLGDEGQHEEALAMVWDPAAGHFLVAALRRRSDSDPAFGGLDGNEALSSLTLDGDQTHLGHFPDDSAGNDVRIKGMAFVGESLYGVSTKSNFLYELDKTNADILSETLLVPPRGVVLDGQYTGMAADPHDGTLYAVAEINGMDRHNRHLITIDPTTGDVAIVGNLGAAFASIAFGNYYAIPEPSSLALSAFAMMACCSAAGDETVSGRWQSIVISFKDSKRKRSYFELGRSCHLHHILSTSA